MMTDASKINWTQLIDDITRNSTMRFADIARALRVHRTTVWRWHQYTIEPPYSAGVQLIKLWSLATSRQYNQIPKTK